MELGRTAWSRSVRNCAGKRCSISLGAQPRCVVATEACASVHEMSKLGHDVSLVPPIYVNPFALGRKSWLFTGSDRSGGDAAKRTGTCRKVARPVVRLWRLIDGWRAGGSGSARRTEPRGALQHHDDDGAVGCARHFAMCLCRALTRHRATQIGRTIGGRDQSTVAAARSGLDPRMAADAGLRDEVEALRVSILAAGCAPADEDPTLRQLALAAFDRAQLAPRRDQRPVLDTHLGFPLFCGIQEQ